MEQATSKEKGSPMTEGNREKVRGILYANNMPNKDIDKALSEIEKVVESEELPAEDIGDERNWRNPGG
jgi:hypothetical protein